MSTSRMKRIRAAQFRDRPQAEPEAPDHSAPAAPAYQARDGREWVTFDAAGNELRRKKGPPWRGVERRD